MSFGRSDRTSSLPSFNTSRFSAYGDQNRFQETNGDSFYNVVDGASKFENALSHDPTPMEGGGDDEGEDEKGNNKQRRIGDTGVTKEGVLKQSVKRRKIITDPPGHLRNLKRQQPRYQLSKERIRWLEEKFAPFARPKTSPVQFLSENPSEASFYFHDIDYTTSDGTKYGPPLIRIAALTEKGNSACIVVRNTPPHFYVKPNRILTARIQSLGADKALAQFKIWLEERVRLKLSDTNQELPQRLVVKTTLLERFPLYGYQKERINVIQVQVANPRLVVPVRDVLWAIRRKKDAFREFEAGDAVDMADDFEQMILDDDGNGQVVQWEDEQAKLVDEQVEFDQSHDAELLRKDPYEVFEADVLFTLRFMIDRDLRGCGWFSVASEKLAAPRSFSERQSRCQLEFWTDFEHIVSRPEKLDVPPEVRLLCYDYEMASRTGEFPDPMRDPIISGSFMLFRLDTGAKPVFAASFYVGESAATQFKGLPEGTPLIDVQFGKGHPCLKGKWDEASEAEMLLSIHWIQTHICDSDYLEGYNSKNFDKPYELHRADTLGIGATVRQCSRLRDELVSVHSKTFSSKAHGTREDASIRTWGIIDWDVLPIVVRDKKLRDYSLNSVGMEVVGETKFGLDHKLIAPYWIGPKATPETRRIVRDYNHQDVWLTHRVQDKLCYVYRNQGMARVTTLPIEMIITRGQAIKTTVLLLRRCKQEGIVMPTFATRQEKLSKAGYGIEPGKYHPDMLGKRYRSALEWDDGDSDDDEEEQARAVHPSKVPTIEKGESANATAAKILQSNLGGNGGGSNSQIKYAAGVDKMMLIQINEGQEEDVGISRRHGVWTSTEKHNEAIKQAYRSLLPGGRLLLLFTAYRHDQNTVKPFYGVAQMVSDFENGLHCQWTDHRFLQNECFRVEWLLQLDRKNPPALPEYLCRHKDCDILNNREVEELFVKGTASFNLRKKKVKEGDKYTGAVVIHPITGLYLVPVWTLDFSSLYPSAIICYNMCWTTLISKEEALSKWTPEDYWVTPFGAYFVRKHVREGLLPKMLVDVIAARNVAKGKLKDAKKSGNLVMVEVYESEQNALKVVANGSYGYTGAKTAPIPCIAIAASTTAYGRDAIMLVWEKIETEFELPKELSPNGERPVIIGGDTDSVFGIWPNCKDPKVARDLAIKAADWVSKKYFRDPMKTVFEKLMFPLLLEGRKRYAYVYWSIESIDKGVPDMVPKPGTKDEKWERIEAKGIETVRRDNCQLVSEGVSSKMRRVLAKRDPIGAFVELQEEVDNLNHQLTDPAMLVVSKSLSKNPEDYDPKPIHAKLALKKRARDPATAPHCGDRVPYVVIQGDDKNDKNSDLGEDPLFALKNGIPLNTKHYIKAYREPCKRLFDPIVPGISERIFDDKPMPETKVKQGSLAAMFQKRKVTDEEQARIDEDLKKKQRMAKDESISGKEKKSTRSCSERPASNLTLRWAQQESKVKIEDVERRLAEDRMKRVGSIKSRQVTYLSKASPLAGITKDIVKCLLCGIAMKCDVCPVGKCDCEGILRAVCTQCDKRSPSEVQKLLQNVKRDAERWIKERDELWDFCNGCAGSIEAAIECANNSCKRFFVRDQAKIEAERNERKLARFMKK